MDIGMYSDVGVRDLNEDSCGYANNLFVVADGMGGAKAGEVASAMAVQRLMRLAGQDGSFPDLLRQAVEEANSAIYLLGHENESYSGMGTTATVLKIDGGVAHIAHVGDSRAYLWRDPGLRLLTDDHTLVGEMVRGGGLTEDEARRHPQRHLLTRALGTEPGVRPEIHEMPVHPDDTFLLCTDGVSGVLRGPDIAAVLKRNMPAQQMAEELVRSAVSAGGQDNASVIVVRVTDI